MVHQLSQPEIGFVEPARTARSNSGTSTLSAGFYAAVKDIATMDSTLIANGYSTANVRKMTDNDKIYALRLLNLA